MIGNILTRIVGSGGANGGYLARSSFFPSQSFQYSKSNFDFQMNEGLHTKVFESPVNGMFGRRSFSFLSDGSFQMKNQFHNEEDYSSGSNEEGEYTTEDFEKALVLLMLGVVFKKSKKSRGRKKGKESKKERKERKKREKKGKTGKDEEQDKKKEEYICGVDLGGQSLRVVLIRVRDGDNMIKAEEIKKFGFPEYDFTKPGTPELVLSETAKYIKKMINEKPNAQLVAIGVGSFGPICLDESKKKKKKKMKKSKKSKKKRKKMKKMMKKLPGVYVGDGKNNDGYCYGCITTTPKEQWRGKDVLKCFEETFPGVPIGFDTDVNAPALHEARHFRCDNLAYITVGTGIGVGLCLNGKPVHGLIHPEGGHMRCPLHAKDLEEKFHGFCEFHKDGCIEGMCAAEAIAKRKGIQKEKIHELKEDDEVFDRVAYYLSHLCCHLLFLTSVEKIVVSGGIMSNPKILPKIREKVPDILGGYLKHPKIENIEQLIVSSDFHPNSGLFGALELARRELNRVEGEIARKEQRKSNKKEEKRRRKKRK